MSCKFSLDPILLQIIKKTKYFSEEEFKEVSFCFIFFLCQTFINFFFRMILLVISQTKSSFPRKKIENTF